MGTRNEAAPADAEPQGELEDAEAESAGPITLAIDVQEDSDKPGGNASDSAAAAAA